jgi:NAD(P)-dependent dehydrogenase (short-subunit alcohol dehydrogenase family)
LSRASVDLSGKVIAVTGASGALGVGVTAILESFGASVAHVDHAPAPARTDGAPSLLFGGVDLADEQAATALMARIVNQAGKLNGLVNIAGGFRWEKLDGGSIESWDLQYRMNLRTAVVCCKAALPYLVQAGNARIVNIGALASVKASVGMGAYAASKAGVAKLTEALADELKDRGVTVNALLPSTLDTARNRTDMPQADFSRWVTPTAIGDIIAFLMSDSASSITGALIPVTGRV